MCFVSKCTIAIMTAIVDILEESSAGAGNGPGTGFYGPDGSFVPGAIGTTVATATVSPLAVDQQVVETENGLLFHKINSNTLPAIIKPLVVLISIKYINLIITNCLV